MTRIRIIVAGLVLVIAGLLTFSTPASAHSAGDAQFWGCAATRQTSNHIIEHAHTAAMGSGYIDVVCQSVSFVDGFRCWWTVRVFSNLNVYGPINPFCVEL